MLDNTRETVKINAFSLAIEEQAAHETKEYVAQRIQKATEEVLFKIEKRKELEAYLNSDNNESLITKSRNNLSSTVFNGSSTNNKNNSTNISTVSDTVVSGVNNIDSVSRTSSITTNNNGNEGRVINLSVNQSIIDTDQVGIANMFNSQSIINNNQDFITTYEKVHQKTKNKEALIKAIKEKYLEGGTNGLYNEEVVNYWENVISELNEGAGVEQLLNDVKHVKFLEFYNRYIEKEGGEALESYRNILITQFENLEQHQDYTHINDEQLKFLLSVKEKLFNKTISVYSLLSEYPELIDLLQLLNIPFNETFKIIKDTLFPKLNIYQNSESIYPNNLGVEAIYGLFKTSNENLLDEVVVHSKSNYIINIGNHKIGQHTIHPSHIIEFLTHFKHQRNICFKEVSTVKDQKYPLLMYDRVSKRIPYLNVIISGYSMASIIKVSRELSRKIDLEPQNYIFNIESKGIFTTIEFEYSLIIPDNEGNELIKFETSNYEVFEELFTAIGYKVPKAQKEQIIRQFIAGIGKGKDKNTIDAYYSSLPTFLYLDDQKSFLKGDNKHLSDDDLIIDLKELLKGAVNDSIGTNEERAIVNICKAISYDRLYKLFRTENTKLLYQVFEELDGEEYKDFTAYLTTVVKHINKKTKGSILFSNEYWMFRNIHVSTSGWRGGNKIKFETYENVRQGFEDDGRGMSKAIFNKNVLKKIPDCHPLDFITLTTKYPNVNEAPSVDVLAFELYNKVHNQKIWDWVNIATDVIGVLTIVGGTGTLVAKGTATGVRLAIGAGIAKEISSILIQNRELTTWLKKEYEDVYKVWFSLDTTGNAIYMAMSLPQLAKFINKSKKAIVDMTVKGFKSASKFSESLVQAVKVLRLKLQFIATDIGKIIKGTYKVDKLIDGLDKTIIQINSTKVKWNTGVYKSIENLNLSLDKTSLIKQNLKILQEKLAELKKIEREIKGFSGLTKKVKKQINYAKDVEKKIINKVKRLENGKISLDHAVYKRISEITLKANEVNNKLEKFYKSNLKWNNKTKQEINKLEDSLDELYNAEVLLNRMALKSKKIKKIESEVSFIIDKSKKIGLDIQNKYKKEIFLDKNKKIKEAKEFRRTNVQVKKIEEKLAVLRGKYSRKNDKLNYKRIQKLWNKTPEIKLGILSKFEVAQLLRYRKGTATNIATGQLEVWYKGKKILSKKDYIASSGSDSVKNSRGVSKSTENLPEQRMKDSEFNFANRTDDSEVKITAAMDEDIAKVITKHFGEKLIDVKQLKIKKKINSTYDPCNVCKRELLIRKELYNSILEINRPIFRHPKKGLIPVRGGDDFTIYLRQNKIQ